MVAAKLAGYEVTVIDAFLDTQTLESADIALLVDYDTNGFNAEALLIAVRKLEPSSYLGFVYGSGFESQPYLIEALAKILTPIGNTSETVRKVKTASVFFETLQRCNITYPAIIKPDDCLASVIGMIYLKKFAGGCGGTHIEIVSTNNATLSDNCYYQQHIEGRDVSLLFMANDNNIEVIGFNEQRNDSSKLQPFRYGGAVSNIELSQNVKHQLIDAAEKLTFSFGLVGLNSLDAIVRDEIVYVLEINPRLSATVDLYENENLFERHVEACMAKLDTKSPFIRNVFCSNASHTSAYSTKNRYLSEKLASSKAHTIVYASTDVLINNDFSWPSWAVDTPLTNQHIKTESPICTVYAVADTANEAKQLALIRVKMIQLEIQNNS